MTDGRDEGRGPAGAVPPPYRPRGKVLSDAQVRRLRDLLLVLLEQDLGLTAHDAQRVRAAVAVHRKHWERRRRAVAPLAARRGSVQMMFEAVEGGSPGGG